MKQHKRQIAVAMTGASGAAYFTRLLDRLSKREDVATHVLASEGGQRVLVEENGTRLSELDLAGFTLHNPKNIGASLASGSFQLSALVVVPCSMNSLCAMATGRADNLILRTAAVQLKEGRPLVVVPRETPLSLIGLKAMVSLKEAGAVIMPASPGFYQQPKTVEDLVDTIVDRILDQLNLEDDGIRRWNP